MELENNAAYRLNCLPKIWKAKSLSGTYVNSIVSDRQFSAEKNLTIWWSGRPLASIWLVTKWVWDSFAVRGPRQTVQHKKSWSPGGFQRRNPVPILLAQFLALRSLAQFVGWKHLLLPAQGLHRHLPAPENSSPIIYHPTMYIHSTLHFIWHTCFALTMYLPLYTRYIIP